MVNSGVGKCISMQELWAQLGSCFIINIQSHHTQIHTQNDKDRTPMHYIPGKTIFIDKEPCCHATHKKWFPSSSDQTIAISADLCLFTNLLRKVVANKGWFTLIDYISPISRTFHGNLNINIWRKMGCELTTYVSFGFHFRIPHLISPKQW